MRKKKLKKKKRPSRFDPERKISHIIYVGYSPANYGYIFTYYIPSLTKGSNIFRLHGEFVLFHILAAVVRIPI